MTDSILAVAIELLPVLQRFDGAHTHAEIHAAVVRGHRSDVTESEVCALAVTLDAHGFLHGPGFLARRDALHRTWTRSASRPARFAGGAYASDPTELRAMLDGHLQAAVNASARSVLNATVQAVISPHIDLHRGGAVYGCAWAPVAHRCEADTFIVLGTCHAPMRGAFTVTDKDFETPLGVLPCARDVVASLERACGDVDLRADELCHRGEHSIEFQAVWLRHVLGNRPARIVPILVGMAPDLARGTDPGGSVTYVRVLDALRDQLVQLGPRACVVAGVDMAHVGPRFGDSAAPDATARHQLEVRDRAGLDRALTLDPVGWFRDVALDDAARRICGLAPVYALASVIPPAWGVRGRLTGYDQAVDATDGSVVTFAAAAFTR